MFINFSPLENRTVGEMMWKDIVEPDRTQMIIWRKGISCWIPKATETLSEYETRIPLPLQQWLHESASMLHLKVHYLSC
jgi:hypothetical protein